LHPKKEDGVHGSGSEKEVTVARAGQPDYSCVCYDRGHRSGPMGDVGGSERKGRQKELSRSGEKDGFLSQREGSPRA